MAFAPAGGWAAGDESFQRRLGFFGAMHEQLKLIAPQTDAIVASLPAVAVELEGIGHCPQLDVPLEAAQLIVGLTTNLRG